MAFIIDESGSVGRFNFDKVKAFIKNIVDFFNIGVDGTHVAVTTYSTNAYTDFNLRSSFTKSGIKAAVDRISYAGGESKGSPHSSDPEYGITLFLPPSKNYFIRPSFLFLSFLHPPSFYSLLSFPPFLPCWLLLFLIPYLRRPAFLPANQVIELPTPLFIACTGWTYTAYALDHVRRTVFNVNRGMRPDPGIPKVAVLLTDGYSNGNWYVGGPAKELRDAGVNVFCIGIGNYNLEELQVIASPPINDHVYRLTSFSDLAGWVDKLSAVSCDGRYCTRL